MAKVLCKERWRWNHRSTNRVRAKDTGNCRRRTSVQVGRGHQKLNEQSGSKEPASRPLPPLSPRPWNGAMAGEEILAEMTPAEDARAWI